MAGKPDVTAPQLPDGYAPGCSNWHCICWEPGAVCDEYMGPVDGSKHCPRCGWTREKHTSDRSSHGEGS